MIAGSGVSDLAEVAGGYGAQTVYIADDARLDTPLPQPRVDVLAALVAAHGFDNVLFAQSVLAADVSARASPLAWAPASTGISPASTIAMESSSASARRSPTR